MSSKFAVVQLVVALAATTLPSWSFAQPALTFNETVNYIVDKVASAEVPCRNDVPVYSREIWISGTNLTYQEVCADKLGNGYWTNTYTVAISRNCSVRHRWGRAELRCPDRIGWEVTRSVSDYHRVRQADTIYVYANTDDEARRLSNAFAHLLSLIGEDVSDPFN